MKTRILLLWLALIFAAPEAFGQQGWRVGARAGVIGVPHTLTTERLGTGVNMGLFVGTSGLEKSNWMVSLDYRKVGNLAMERLNQRTFVLPDGLIREEDFFTISGFTAFRFGVRWDRAVKSFRSGTLKVGLAGYTDVMAYTRASRFSRIRRNVLRNRLNEDELVELTSSASSGSTKTTRETTEDGTIVLTGGTGLVYTLATGPEFELGLQIDFTDRFSTFSGSSDARLTQVYLGFSYPFSAIKSKKQ